MNKNSDIKEQTSFDTASGQDRYEKLFSLLGKMEQDQPAKEFSGLVVRKIERTERNLRLIYLLSVIGGMVIVIAMALAALYYFGSVQVLLEHKDVTIWAVLTGLLIVLIQYLDTKLVKKKRFLAG